MQALDLVIRVLAAESSCRPVDLSSRTVTICERLPGRSGDPMRRMFTSPDPVLGIVSLGLGGVVSASQSHLPWVTELFKGTERDGLFEPYRLGVAASRLRAAGQRLIGPVPRFVVSPEDFRSVAPPEGCEITIEPPSSVRDLVAQDWPHALMRRRGEEAPIRLVARAIINGSIAGLTTAVEDHTALWQIGIGVAAESRGTGIGRALAAAISGAVLERGIVPYWCTNPANLASIRTAISVGYKPAWLEVFTKNEPVELTPINRLE